MSKTLDRERQFDTHHQRDRSEKEPDSPASGTEIAGPPTQREGDVSFLKTASTNAPQPQGQGAAHSPTRRTGRMLLLLLIALFAYAGTTRPELWRFQAWLTQRVTGWKDFGGQAGHAWSIPMIPHSIRFAKVGGLFEAPAPSSATASPPPILRPLSITPPLSLVMTRDFVVMAERVAASSPKEPSYPVFLLNAERQAVRVATLRTLQLMDAAIGSAARLAAAANNSQAPNLSENTAPND